MTDLLEVRGLRVAYGGIEALHGVDLSVSEGVVSAILGPNGAGKTSILRGITGFERWESGRVTSGSVRFAGTPIAGWSPERVARFGLRLVPERQPVFLELTVRENLRIALAAGRRRTGFAQTCELVWSLFPILLRRESQVAGLLSGGERQMLGVALQLLGQPALLLLDEASFGLAPSAVKALFGALREIKAHTGIGIVVVEQNVDAALDIADYVHLVQGGRVASHGPVAAMRDDRSIYEQYVVGVTAGEQR